MNKNYIVSNLKLLSSEKASLCKNNHQAMSVAWEQTLNIRMSALLSGAQWSPRHCLGQAGCLKTPLLHSVVWLSLMLIDSAYATIPNWGERCPSSSKPGEVSVLDTKALKGVVKTSWEVCPMKRMKESNNHISWLDVNWCSGFPSLTQSFPREAAGN